MISSSKCVKQKMLKDKIISLATFNTVKSALALVLTRGLTHKLTYSKKKLYFGESNQSATKF